MGDTIATVAGAGRGGTGTIGGVEVACEDAGTGGADALAGVFPSKGNDTEGVLTGFLVFVDGAGALVLWDDVCAVCRGFCSSGAAAGFASACCCCCCCRARSRALALVVTPRGAGCKFCPLDRMRSTSSSLFGSLFAELSLVVSLGSLSGSLYRVKLLLSGKLPGIA